MSEKSQAYTNGFAEEAASVEADSKPERASIVIKKYANRRLYNTDTSTYVTLDDLAAMVRAERDFVVFDARHGRRSDPRRPDPNHRRAGEQGQSEFAADRLPAATYPLLRQFDGAAGSELSGVSVWTR